MAAPWWDPKNCDDYTPPTPFPIDRDGEPLFIEFTGNQEIDDLDGSVSDFEEAFDERMARVKSLIATNSPPLVDAASISSTSTVASMDDENSPTAPTTNTFAIADEESSDHEPVLAPDSTGELRCFSKLPLEIKTMIWKATMIPRIIEFRPGGAKTPGALHACQESRRLLRKHYELRISVLHLEDYDDTSDYGIFVNWDIDLVNISPLGGNYPACQRFIPPSPIQIYHDYEAWGILVKRMVVDMGDRKALRGNDGTWHAFFERITRDLPNLEEVLVVCNGAEMEPYQQLVPLESPSRKQKQSIKQLRRDLASCSTCTRSFRKKVVIYTTVNESSMVMGDAS